MLQQNRATPLYVQLMDQVKRAIDTGVYQSGDQLPPELEMARRNGVSVITARKAMNELAAQGIVEKKQGKGTFVTVPKYDRDYTKIRGFSESCRAMGLKPGSRLLEHRVLVPGEKILKALRLPPESETVLITRLRYVNGEPVAIELTYFSMEYRFLLRESFENSLFTILEEQANVRVEKSSKLIEICRATPKEAKLLNLHQNDPLLLVRSTAYAADDTPIYACSQIINGERFQLMI